MDDWDLDAWLKADERDWWVFDKLILARKMGYVCGPHLMPVPESGEYCVRPIVNFYGMGVGAEIKYLTPDDYATIPPGYFWCEKFEGRHISVDYDELLTPIKASEGFRNEGDPLYRFSRWEKIDMDLLPDFPVKLHGQYDRTNVEFIGDKVVEIHLRDSSDPQDVNVIWGDKAIDDDSEDAEGWLPEVRLGFRKNDG